MQFLVACDIPDLKEFDLARQQWNHLRGTKEEILKKPQTQVVSCIASVLWKLRLISHETDLHEFIMELVQYRFPPMLFTVLNNVVITCENKGEVADCDNSSESYEGAFS